MATSSVLAKANILDPRAGEVRLNLGGRNRPLGGFKTVDLFDGEHVDIKSDCADLSMFEDGSVKEIYASHILEHWPHVKTLDVLKEWRRVLEKRGTLWISVPSFDAVIKLVERFGFNDFIRNLLYGDQLYPLAFHYTIFTYPTLASLCIQAGFEDVKQITTMPYGLIDCSKNIDTVTKKPISLNVKVTA